MQRSLSAALTPDDPAARRGAARCGTLGRMLAGAEAPALAERPRAHRSPSESSPLASGGVSVLRVPHSLRQEPEGREAGRRAPQPGRTVCTCYQGPAPRRPGGLKLLPERLRCPRSPRQSGSSFQTGSPSNFPGYVVITRGPSAPSTGLLLYRPRLKASQPPSDMWVLVFTRRTQIHGDWHLFKALQLERGRSDVQARKPAQGVIMQSSSAAGLEASGASAVYSSAELFGPGVGQVA
ncbi:uncharacterized protein LOC125117888 [Phacochoerus africanus]|uniref:uncharacterized protein LOC125117888 n=1 Tax=Phacochoerus africanus TaxID=41426 RepID=UPI001FD8E5C4|nr:uncharacterized protein LOC125117888 [Phacochoerus africanus]